MGECKMCKPTCLYCGFESDDEIVTHINDSHPGALGRYLLFFGAAPVVSEEVYAACVNSDHGAGDTGSKALLRIPMADREAIVAAREQSLPLRSLIQNVEDF
jgi:hypothetical protein